MNNLIAIAIAAVIIGALSFGALNLSNSAVENGMLSLNRKYAGKCVSLSDGRRATIIAIKAKTLQLSVGGSKGVEEVIEVERLPLDKYLVACPAASM